MKREEFDKLTRPPGFGGWLSTEDQEWLVNLLCSLEYPDDYKPTVVEVGVFQGGQTLIYLTALPNCYVYAVDNWQGGPPSPPWKNIKDAFIATVKDYHDRVTLVTGDSKLVGAQWDTPADIIMIDGCHNKDYPITDVKNFAQWVKVGGYLLVDDSHMRDVQPAIVYMQDRPDFSTVRISRDVSAFKRERE